MRVSPVGFAFQDEKRVIKEATLTAEITHNHPEGIKGAQATALAVFLARTGNNKEQIRSKIESRFDYDFDRTIDSIRPSYSLDLQGQLTCQGTVPEAIIAFLDSDSYEDAIRNAISIGGDSDTLACITGGIAEAFYGGVPAEISKKVMEYLPSDLRSIVDEFCDKYGSGDIREHDV
jgi:ADP-ribosylglycohydrolase